MRNLFNPHSPHREEFLRDLHCDAGHASLILTDDLVRSLVNVDLSIYFDTTGLPFSWNLQTIAFLLLRRAGALFIFLG